MNLWTVVLALSMVTLCAKSQQGNLQLFWNLYNSVVTGSRILNDLAEGAGAVSKAINAIDVLIDSFDDDKIDLVKNGKIEKIIGKVDPKTDPTIQSSVDEKIDSRIDPAEQNDPKASNGITSQTDDKTEEVPPVFNGCGALGFHIRDQNLPVAKMTQCCQPHDDCYASGCKHTRKDCDAKLRSCLFSKCDKISDRNIQKTCRSAAHLLYSGKMALNFSPENSSTRSQECKQTDRPEKRKNGR